MAVTVSYLGCAYFRKDGYGTVASVSSLLFRFRFFSDYGGHKIHDFVKIRSFRF